MKRPICLIILDGWGISKFKKGNAIWMANTPNMDNFINLYPHTLVDSSGEAVGLPEGQMGNSEVGHLNIGAGRIVYQEFTRISKSIKNGDFFKNPILNRAIDNAKERNSSLHVMGLVSDGGVHSHIDHLKAIINMAGNKKIENLYIHAFLDGRDVPPRSAIPYLNELYNYLKENNIGEIATVSGRYYSMDRDNRWERTEKSYRVLVYRKGAVYKSPALLVEDSYKNNLNDEFVIPALVEIKNDEKGKIKTGDSVIFFNFRPDRARQLTRSFIFKDFDKFDRGQNPPEVFFTCMTQYDKKFDTPVAYPPQKINNTLGEVISKHDLKQLRIAETEKYAHVTFFFNGGIESPYRGEDRILIPSPKVSTYDLKPEMSAHEVSDRIRKEIEKMKYDFIVLNFANPDMVGHTGKLDAAIKAIETVDGCIGEVVGKINQAGGLALITADHGNAEEMINPEDNGVVTAHSTSPVPFIICGKNYKIKNLGTSYRLSDIAPTVLKLMGIKKPPEMTGNSII